MILITGKKFNSKITSIHVFIVKYLFRFVIPKFLDEKIYNTSETIGEFKKYMWLIRRLRIKGRCKVCNIRSSRIRVGRIKKKRRFISVKKKNLKSSFFNPVRCIWYDKIPSIWYWDQYYFSHDKEKPKLFN